MLRIWGRTNSSNVMKVLWLCDELGLAYERVDAGGPFGRTRDPDYLAMNPNAAVPTIQDGSFTLWESNSILRYLARIHAPGRAIYPADARRAADCERWMDWQLASLNPPMTTIFWNLVRTPEDRRDHAAVAAARDTAEACWAMLEPRLARSPFICGEGLTLADVALGPYVHRWFALPIERKEMPGLSAWYGRLKSRLGYARWCAVEMT